MLYVMMHLTHFYLWLYGIGHMIKDHSNSKRLGLGNRVSVTIP